MKYDEQVIDNINRQEEIDNRINGLLNAKPRLYKQGKWWVCVYNSFKGCGITPKIAYSNLMAQFKI